METINLYAAWIGILLGFIAGMISGLYFHDDNWLGGYGSWARRMTRLGHISFFGLAFVNFAYAVTIQMKPAAAGSLWPAWLFIVGAITMPAVCYLSAFRKGLRHLFVIPVASLLIGAAVFLVELI